MVSKHLLDANVLIALTVAEHEHHDRAASWAARADRLALCPTVEGALVRFLVKIGERAGVATELLRSIKHLRQYEFWPDSLSYADADLAHVQGHRQVSDGYLASLAQANGGLLATLDASLARELPDTVVLLPSGG
jgi:predicted nucleic acid-binding protein